VIEKCENITFLCHAYVYDELLLNFKKAKLSVFNNKWNDVFDFKIYSSDPKADKQIKFSAKVDPNFVASFDKVYELISKASKIKGEALTSIDQVKGIKLDDIELEFGEPEEKLDLGPYFSKNSNKMLKGVPPTKVGKDRDNFTNIAMLVVFVKDLD
jgi:hypothetical protein